MRHMQEELYERDLTVSQSQKITEEKEIYIKKLNDSIYFLARDRDVGYLNSDSNWRIRTTSTWTSWPCCPRRW